MQVNVENRLARVRITGQVIVGMLALGNNGPWHTEGLPADVRFLYAHYDWESNSFAITVASATFDPVPENVIPPYLTVTVTREGFHRPRPTPIDAPATVVAPLPGDEDE